MKTLDLKELRLNHQPIPIPSVYWHVTRCGRITEGCDAFFALLGSPKKKLLGEHFGKFLPTPDCYTFMEDLAFTLKNPGEKTRAHWEILDHKGKALRLSTSLEPVRDVVKIKVEEVEKLERDPNEMADAGLFEYFFDTETQPILVIDQNQDIIKCNDTFKMHFMQMAKDCRGHKVSDIAGFPADASSGDLFQAKNGDAYRLRKRMVGTKGDLYWVWSFLPQPTAKIPGKTQRAALGEEEMYTALMENSQDCIFFVDIETMLLVDANKALSNRLGYSKEELLQLAFYDLLDGTQEDVEKITLHATRKSGFLAEHQYITKEGQRIPMEANIKKVEVGSHDLLCIIARDMTERKRAERAEDNYKKDLEDRVAERTRALRLSSEELSQFAYIASHDLKTPLRAISSIVSWLAHDYKDKFDHKGKAQLRLLIDRTRRMHNFIDGISSYTSIGQENEGPKKVNLDKIINQIVAQYSVIYPSATITLDNRLAPVFYQQTSAEQVFINLVENALRHNDKPKPNIRIGSKPIEGKTVYYVNDNGPGIPSRYQEKIFKMFQTLVTKDEKESIGIGLTIAKKIIESNGGKIWLESPGQKGATFYFYLT